MLKMLFKGNHMKTTLVFTRTKHKAKNLARQLTKAGFSATSLQGNLSQNKRQKALEGFRDGIFNILVATDIAARGIDIRGISHVINYDLPDTFETYTHRTGRTGRADQKGQAYSFVCREDRKKVRLLEKKMGKKMQHLALPSIHQTVSTKNPDHAKTKPSHREKQRQCSWSKSLVVA